MRKSAALFNSPSYACGVVLSLSPKGGEGRCREY